MLDQEILSEIIEYEEAVMTGLVLSFRPIDKKRKFMYG